jgi:hypothetical protein
MDGSTRDPRSVVDNPFPQANPFLQQTLFAPASPDSFSGWKLERLLTDRMPDLPDERNSAIIAQGKDSHPSGMLHVCPLRRPAIGQSHSIPDQSVRGKRKQLLRIQRSFCNIHAEGIP